MMALFNLNLLNKQNVAGQVFNLPYVPFLRDELKSLDMPKEDDAYVTICIPATANFMKVVREAIQQAAEDFGFSEDDGAEIVMAVDEACTNVVQHGKSEESDQHLKLYLRVAFSIDRLIVELVDKAQRFSPAENKGPTVDEFLASGKTHGIGLYVIHKLVDEVEHDYTEGKGNRLRLIKILPLEPQN